MTGQQRKHVFISYVCENQDQVYPLCADMEKTGVNVCLDRNDIKPNAHWKAAIHEVIINGFLY